MNTTISISTDEDKLEAVKAFLKALKIKFEIAEETDGDSKKSIISNIKKGLKEVRLAKQGKLKTTPAKDFLNEL